MQLFQKLTYLCIFLLLAGCKSSEKEDRGTDQQAEAVPKAEGGKTLFNGKNLDGWKVLGADTSGFSAEDGVIVGTTLQDLPNTFLVTEKAYDDFILEVDFKIEDYINSGIQIRSNTHNQDTTTNYLSGKLEESTRDWKKGRVYGYQIEIDPSERKWTGGFYEEGGRGWLVPLADKPEARQAYNHGEWNHMTIKAEGNRIQAWVNSVQTVNTTDDKADSGFIGLQLHGAWKEEQIGQKVRWKNIRIKEL